MTHQNVIKQFVPVIDIAENDFGLFIHLDKALLENARIKKAVKILKEFDLKTIALPPLDLEGIPEVSDEEQAEIEASLEAMSEEDKEIAHHNFNFRNFRA